MGPTPAAATAAPSESVELYYSKPRAAVVLAVGSVASLWIGHLVLAGLLAGNVVLLLAGVAAMVAAGPVLLLFVVESLRAMTFTGAVVRLDTAGITDARKKDAFLGWDEVGRVTLGDRQQTRAHLIISFRSERVARARGQGTLTSWLRTATSLGDWHVNLRPLKCNTADVLRAAIRFQQRSVRRQVIDRNGPSSQGWSGTL